VHCACAAQAFLGSNPSPSAHGSAALAVAASGLRWHLCKRRASCDCSARRRVHCACAAQAFLGSNPSPSADDSAPLAVTVSGIGGEPVSPAFASAEVLDPVKEAIRAEDVVNLWHILTGREFETERRIGS